MPNYLLYTPDVETVPKDEPETIQKIVMLMSKEAATTREKYGRPIRTSHAKAHAVLKGKLVVRGDLDATLAQGLFAKPATYDVLVRMASAPGELLDDSKVNSTRGMAIKVLGVEGSKVAGHAAETQDFVLSPGKVFIAPTAAVFLQAFKANAEIAPKLSDTAKGVVSTISRVTNAALNAVGVDSAKLDFYGHKLVNPLGEPQYSQTPYRCGEYVAKFAVKPDTAGLKALEDDSNYKQETHDALRDACNTFLRNNAAEYSFQVQLNTGVDEMPVEDATVEWPEGSSMYQEVARLTITPQIAWDQEKDAYVEPLSFAPEHALEAHKPLGGINRARMGAYAALSQLRRSELHTNFPAEPAGTDTVPV